MLVPSSDAKGRVFLCHSSKDKPFVRDLASGLLKHGFLTWLDEKDMAVGDVLVEEVSRAIELAGAIAVVVSPNSVDSDWVKYELSLASERFIKRDVRVIPILIGDVSLPPELRGRLYADFRTSFDHGLTLVVKALEQESGIAREPWRMFHYDMQELLSFVFKGVGWTSLSREFGSIDWDVVSIPPVPTDPEGGEIAYELVAAYGGRRRPIDRDGFHDYLDMVQQYGVGQALMITERPPEFVDDTFDLFADSRVAVKRVASGDVGPYDDLVVVVVDVSDSPEPDSKLFRIETGRGVFETHRPTVSDWQRGFVPGDSTSPA